MVVGFAVLGHRVAFEEVLLGLCFGSSFLMVEFGSCFHLLLFCHLLEGLHRLSVGIRPGSHLWRVSSVLYLHIVVSEFVNETCDLILSIFLSDLLHCCKVLEEFSPL